MLKAIEWCRKGVKTHRKIFGSPSMLENKSLTIKRKLAALDIKLIIV
jgi:hypothetical protein